MVGDKGRQSFLFRVGINSSSEELKNFFIPRVINLEGYTKPHTLTTIETAIYPSLINLFNQILNVKFKKIKEHEMFFKPNKYMICN